MKRRDYNESNHGCEYPEEIPATGISGKTVQQYLIDAAKNFPRKIAIHFMGKEMTYKELYESALKFASYLQKIGINKGDRVAIMLPNTPQAVISYFGILWLVELSFKPIHYIRNVNLNIK